MVQGLIGGILIGFAATIMLIYNGRVTGISGIVSGLLKPNKGDTAWRLHFVSGLLAGGFILYLLNPEVFSNSSDRSVFQISLAGFLVGFGTLMGNGCTSGHGVCGVSRMSPRSIVATLTFMFFGFVVVNWLAYLSKGSL